MRQAPIAPTMSAKIIHEKRERIQEGGVARRYLEAIHPNTAPERKAELEEQLLRYCRFDTATMVEIVKYFMGLDE